MFFGSRSINDNPYCGITRFDIIDLTQVTTKKISTNVTSFACRTESALTFLENVYMDLEDSLLKNLFLMIYSLFL